MGAVIEKWTPTAALHNQVAFAIGNIFFLNGGGSHPMRLNFGLQTLERINEDFRRLRRVWRNLACDYDELEKSRCSRIVLAI